MPLNPKKSARSFSVCFGNEKENVFLAQIRKRNKGQTFSFHSRCIKRFAIFGYKSKGSSKKRVLNSYARANHTESIHRHTFTANNTEQATLERNYIRFFCAMHFFAFFLKLVAVNCYVLMSFDTHAFSVLYRCVYGSRGVRSSGGSTRRLRGMSSGTSTHYKVYLL